MFAPLYTFSTFGLSIASYLLGIKSSTKCYHAGKALIESMSYRLEAGASKDPFILIRVWKRIIAALLKGHRIQRNLQSSSKKLIYDSTHHTEKLKTEYVAFHTGETIPFYPRTELLYIGSFLDLLLFVPLLLVLSVVVLPFTFISKRRANMALLLFEFVENSNLLSLCSKNGITKVHMFGAYEKDANVLTCLLNKRNITIAKHPSPGPLTIHHSIVLADELVLTSQYQFDELPSLKETIFAEKISKWLPEYALEYYEKYSTQTWTPPANVIGYYSHGAWLRQAQEHADDGVNIHEAEAVLIKELSEFMKKNRNFTLIIFPHPREKRANALEKTKQYYEKFFGGLPYTFIGPEVKSSQAFDQVNVAVAAYSSIVYERLFCGFKTLIGCFGIAGFPIPGTSLANIAIKNPVELNDALLTAMKQSNDDFFERNNLIGYRYFEYPNLAPRR